MRPEIGGCSGDDAVVISRKALRFFESLPAARRASIPVRMFGSISIIGGEDGLNLDGHLMDRSISEINDLLGMAGDEACISNPTFVPGICRRSGIAPSKRVPHEGIPDFSRPAAIPDAHELAVPTRRRHPHFKLDVGILRRFDFSGDAAERR